MFYQSNIMRKIRNSWFSFIVSASATIESKKSRIGSVWVFLVVFSLLNAGGNNRAEASRIGCVEKVAPAKDEFNETNYGGLYSLVKHYSEWQLALKSHKGAILKYLKPTKASPVTILDAGSAGGLMAAEFFAMEGVEVLAQDFEPDMVKKARARLAELAIRIQKAFNPDSIVQGDISKKLHTGSYDKSKNTKNKLDGIVSHSVIWNLTRKQMVSFVKLSEKELNADGIVSFSSIHPEKISYLTEGFKRHLNYDLTGHAPEEEVDSFVEKNDSLLKVIAEQLDYGMEDVVTELKRSGFKILEVNPLYEVEVDGVKHGLFYHIIARKFGPLL